MKFAAAAAALVVVSLLVARVSLGGGAEAASGVSQAGMSFAEWQAAFSAAKELQTGGTVKEDGVEYKWTGPIPVTVRGEWIPKSRLGLSSGEIADLQAVVFQPEPVEYARIVTSPNWVRIGVASSKALLFSGGPADCQVIVVQTGVGTFTTTCDGPCPKYQACHGNTSSQPSF